VHRDASQNGVIGRHVAHGNPEQTEPMLGCHARIDLNRADAACEQQSGELGDLRVARQQMLAMPVQAGRADLPLDRPQTGECRQRGGDVAHRFEHRRMRRRIQARQPECRTDRAQRTVHCSSVDRHG